MTMAIKIYETLSEGEFRIIDLNISPNVKNIYTLYKKYFGKVPKKKYLSKEYVREYIAKHRIKSEVDIKDFNYSIININELYELKSYAYFHCNSTHFYEGTTGKFTMLVEMEHALQRAKEILSYDEI